MNPTWGGMFPQPMPAFNAWTQQQLFQQFQLYLQQSGVLFDSFNVQMKFNYFQQYIISIQNPLAFQPIQIQNQVFQQFLMWRQNQLFQPPPTQPTQQTQTGQPNQGVLPRTGQEAMTVGNVGGGAFVLNITMNASTGHKVVINATGDTTVENLLLKYTEKLGLPPTAIGKDITFLYNGAQLDAKSKQTIGSIFRNTAVITVYDLNGIIGA